MQADTGHAEFTCIPGLEKSSVLLVLDRILKLKTDLFLYKKLKIGP